MNSKKPCEISEDSYFAEWGARRTKGVDVFFYVRITSLIALVAVAALFATSIEFEPSDGAGAIQDSIYYSPADSLLFSGGTYYIGDLGPSGLVVLDSLALVCIDGAGACTLSAFSSDLNDTSATVITSYFGDPVSLATTIHGFVITGAEGESGGGIMAYNGCPSLDSCVITGNHADSSGGGLMVVSANAEIRNTVISNNSSNSGGGIFAYDADLIVMNCKFEDNSAISGAGIFAHEGSYDFGLCDFHGNIADSSGGGLFLSGADADFSSTIIEENEARDGGGFYCYASNIDMKSGSEIILNHAHESGGGVFLVECDIDMSEFELSMNTGWTGAGGMLVDVVGVMEQANFLANSGTNGGCFMLTSCNEYEMTIAHSLIKDNQAWEGGAFFIDSCEVVISDCIFNSNNSVGYGGIFFLHRGRNLIEENDFSGNRSVGDGAGLFFYRDKSIISRNRFEMNEAHTYGGALYVYGNSEPVVRENLFNSNKVFYGAAIYVEYQSKPHFIKNTVVGNIGNMGSSISVCEASILRADSCFFADNGSIENRVSGLGSAVANAESVYIMNSNVYYNTLYSEAYWANSCSLDNIMTGNFWWTTDTFEIREFLEGPIAIEPISEEFVAGVPGEPHLITSVRSLDRDYLTDVSLVESIGDTIYLQVEGQDRNPHFYEAAVLRIRSDGSDGDIAVALAETDSCSGVYRGLVFVAEATDSDTLWRDDVFNRIRVNREGDTIRFYANIDTTAFCEVVYADATGIAEGIKLPDTPSISAYPNPFNSAVKIAFDCHSRESGNPEVVSVEIFDLSGRRVAELTPPAPPSQGGKEGKSPLLRGDLGGLVWQPAASLGSGVYLVRARMNGGESTSKRIVYLK